MAIPGGPGGPKDPVRDRPQDPGHGTPPTKPRPEPVRDRPQDPGHGTPPSSGSGGGGGSHSPYRPGTGQTAPSPPAWVIRRQQILKRAGFGVAVDGNWGPNSSAAWNAYQAGQKAGAGFKMPAGPQAELPKGFVYYQGRVVPKQIATAAQAVANAKTDAAAITNRHFLDEIRQVRQQVAAQKAAHDVARTGEDLHTAYATEMANRHRQHNLVAAARQDIAQNEAQRDQLLFGVHGAAMLSLNPRIAHERLSNLADAHDLSRLISTGTLDIRRPTDVETIQKVINRSGGDVKVTGKYDNQTNEGIKKLWDREKAAEFTKGVKGLQTQFFHSGLGAWATFKVFGHTMTAAETYGVLERGGPRAGRLAKYLGLLYMQSEPFANQARQQLAGQVYHTQTGDVHYGHFSDGELRKYLGADTFKAHNLGDLYARYGAEADRLRFLAAKHSTSWWQDAVGYVYNKVDIPYSNQAIDVMSWSGHQGYHLLATSTIFVFSNLDAVNNSTIGLGPSSWLGRTTGFGIDVPGLLLEGSEQLTPMPELMRYILPDESAWKGNGFTAPDKAWHKGWVTMADMAKSDPLRSMVWESVADPLNFVGVGEGMKLTEIVARSGRLAGELSTRAVIATAVGSELDWRAPTVAKILRGAAAEVAADQANLKHLAYAFHLGADGVRQSDIAIKLMRSKAEGLSVAKGLIESHVARNFQDFAKADIVKSIVKQDAESVAKAAKDALEFDPAGKLADVPADERAAVKAAGERGGFAQRTLDPDLNDELQTVMRNQVSFIQREFKGFADAIGDLGTSLYRHRDRVGGLSQPGARLAAWLTEMANRSILDALAVHVSGGDAVKLEALKARLGSWYAGRLDVEMAQYAEQALSDFRAVLYEQILPDLDTLARGKLSASAFDTDGFLFSHFEEQALIKTEKLMGLDLAKVFDPKNFVRVINPGAREVVSYAEAGDLMSAEIGRRIERLEMWASRAAFTKRGDPAAVKRIWESVPRRKAEIQAEVNAAWKVGPVSGTLQDSRDFLEVPSIYAHGDPAFGSLEQMTPFGKQIQGLLDAALSTGSSPVANRIPPAGLADLITKRGEALARARSAVSGHYYRQQFLLLESFNHSQRPIVRGLWKTYTLGMETWRLAVLPLRMAFPFKNHVEDLLKIVTSGYLDPRYLLNSKGQSVFDFVPYRLVRAIASGFDRIWPDAHVADAMDAALKGLLARHPEGMSKLFGLHGVPIPDHLLSNSTVMRAFLDEREAQTTESNLLRRFHDRAWDLLGNRGDNWRKRALYAAAYNKALKDGGSELDGFAAGMDAYDRAVAANLDPDLVAKQADTEVDRVLFMYDPDHVNVLEAQLKVAAPFIVYWRKNVQYFASELNKKPWYFADGKRLYDLHTESNKDQPEWQRRYFNLGVLGGISDRIPGMPDWVGQAFRDAYWDPMDYTGTAAFYRIFKSKNPNLPPDQQGGAFASAIVGNFNALGIGLNPFAVALAENTHVIDQQVWRDMFPQTSIIQALTTKGFVQDTWGSATGFNIEDFIFDETFGRLGADSHTDARSQSYDYYINAAIAAQVARGETPDRAKATRDVAKFQALSMIVSFTTGVYMRHITENDLYFYDLREKLGKGLVDFRDLTDREQESYRLWSKKGYSPDQFDRYREAQETARIFFQLPDDKRDDFLLEHPEIIGFVHPIAGDDAHIPTQIGIRNQLLANQTGLVMDLLTGVFSDPNFAPNVKSAAYDALVTPELRAFWARNDTPAERRARHIKGAYFHYIDRISRTFHAIPEKDFDTKQKFLAAHPELNQYWALNDSASDDLRSIELSANSTFRNLYFRFVDNGNWDGADAFLKRHSFIFDWTSAEGRVDPNGQWHPRTTAQADYAKVADRLGIYYTLHGHAREQYLAANPLVSWYLKKYGHVGTDIWSKASSYSPGGLNQHALDYLAVKAQLDAFFKLDNAGKEAFLAAHPELKAYFAKYGHQRTQSQHARDYLAIKPVMDQFFALPEADRAAFLAKHPELQAYFSRYGSAQHHAAFRSVLASDPEMADRYHFWQRFFALPPDERPAFIHKHAADAGIFIYGSLGYDQRQRDYQRWHREALRSGTSDRAVAFRHVKPLLDMYFSLKGKDRSLFAELNPEVQWYFDHFAKTSTTIPSAIADELQTYFQYQPYSEQRKQYIIDHPELAHYFNSTQSPAEKAILKQVEAFFALPFGTKRDDYLATHPELGVWFDQRKQEKANYMSVAAAFNETDPRMKPFYEQYADIIPMDRLKQWQLAHQHGKKSKTAHGIESRRGREEAVRIVAPGWTTSSG